MRNFKLLTFIFIVTICFFGCKKNEQPTDQEIVNNSISQVIPKKYLDTLRNLGIVINEGTKPPNLEGIYIIAPHKLSNTNIPNDPYWYQNFADAKLKLTNQRNVNFSIQFYGKNYFAANDTSIVAAISGYENKFTVYGKVKATDANGIDYVIGALIISGTLEGNGIKNLQTGVINIDGSHNASIGNFILEGQARITYDADNFSASTYFFRNATTNTNAINTLAH
jgi:hypothetical protein